SAGLAIVAGSVAWSRFGDSDPSALVPSVPSGALFSELTLGVLALSDSAVAAGSLASLCAVAGWAVAPLALNKLARMLRCACRVKRWSASDAGRQDMSESVEVRALAPGQKWLTQNFLAVLALCIAGPDG